MQNMVGNVVLTSPSVPNPLQFHSLLSCCSTASSPVFFHIVLLDVISCPWSRHWSILHVDALGHTATHSRLLTAAASSFPGESHFSYLVDPSCLRLSSLSGRSGPSFLASVYLRSFIFHLPRLQGNGPVRGGIVLQLPTHGVLCREEKCPDPCVRYSWWESPPENSTMPATHFTRCHEKLAPTKTAVSSKRLLFNRRQTTGQQDSEDIPS